MYKIKAIYGRKSKHEQQMNQIMKLEVMSIKQLVARKEQNHILMPFDFLFPNKPNLPTENYLDCHLKIEKNKSYVNPVYKNAF